LILCFCHWQQPTKLAALLLQVGFHSDKLVKKTQVARRLNEIVNRLNKTQVCWGGCSGKGIGSLPWALLQKSSCCVDFSL
jgi:hypothetical protein